jgi:ABC-type glycerol-3-phosphate transport system substrate-binding protein
MAVLVALLATPLFAGGEQEASKDGKITLSYWHLWGGSRTELVEELVAKYKEDHPNVNFDVTFTPPNELKTKVVQAAGTGTLPDVTEIKSNWMQELNAENTLMPLDDMLAEDDIVIEDVLLANEAKRSYYNGTVYSLPNVTAGGKGLFFYNKDLMEEAGLDPVADAPKNFDEFTEVSKRLVRELNPGDTLKTIAWDPWQMAGPPALIYFSLGKDCKTVSADHTESMLDQECAVNTAKRFDNYIQEVYGPYGGYEALIRWYADVAGVETGAAQVQGFIKSQQAFYVSGSWTIGQVNQGNPDMNFSILPVPGFEGPQGSVSKHGWSYAIAQDTKHPEAAFDFLKFITLDPEGNGWFCKQQRRPCPIASVNDDDVYGQMGKMWENLMTSMRRDIYPEASSVDQDTLKPWIRDFPSRRVAGESVESIMEDIDQQYQSYLDDLNE